MTRNECDCLRLSGYPHIIIIEVLEDTIKKPGSILKNQEFCLEQENSLSYFQTLRFVEYNYSKLYASYVLLYHFTIYNMNTEREASTMDLVKIGKFIAEMRKLHQLTQMQLADELCVSDKTISKWECGKGLPEVSLMLPLCEKLEISVNDLLSGEKVTDCDYERKAEETMMNLMKENEESKKKFTISVINGIIVIIAVISLALLAAFLEIPVAARIALIVLALVTAVFGVAGSAILDKDSGVFECPFCNEMFVPSMKDYINGVHTITKRSLTCPKCGKTGMCKHRITR